MNHAKKMWEVKLAKKPLAVLVGALLQAAYGYAQEAPAADGAAAVDANNKGLNLETVVVTGTSSKTTKMRSSISVSSLDGDQLLANQPQNASDLLSTIPGIFVQSSGGGGNANVSVRGLPISAGGSRYVQFQEDGLPVLLFGDIAFGNPDDFMRIDTTVDHVEVVRGGTGSTLTTNGPGGIINLITKTGEETGGSVGVTTGLGYREQRFDFNYGGHLSDKTRYFIGGYYDSGVGPRKDSAASLQGGQIRGNITHEFDQGYVRLNFKYLSDQQPMYMPVPVDISNGNINTIAGIDPRHYTGYSANMPIDTVLTNNNTLSTIHLNKGTEARSAAVGLETHLNIGSGWVLDDKFRAAQNSGQWAGFFPGSSVAAAPADATYANGVNQGKAYSGPAFTNVIFDVDVKDLGSTTNDLKLTRSLNNIGGGELTYGAGLFTNTQKVDLVWNFNAYLTSASSSPAPINSAIAGTTAYGFQGPAWGACCERDYAASYQTTAPYVFANYRNGPLTVDAGFREDNQKASGYYNIATVAAGAPATTMPTYAAANAVPVDYRVSHPEYSIGTNYLINRDVSVFARYSQGASFNADRIMANGPLSGSASIPINTVDQLEGGVKARFGALSTFVTLFDAKTSEFNYTNNFQVLSTNKYEGKGVELESGYRIGDYHFNLGLTYTDAKVLASTNPAQVGQPENRQPKWIYLLGGGYAGDAFDIGVNVQGVSSATETDNTAPNNRLPAYTIVTGHVDYKLAPTTVVSLGVYNLFNKLAYTELDGTTSARALNGRTAKLSLKYSF